MGGWSCADIQVAAFAEMICHHMAFETEEADLRIMDCKWYALHGHELWDREQIYSYLRIPGQVPSQIVSFFSSPLPFPVLSFKDYKATSIQPIHGTHSP